MICIAKDYLRRFTSRPRYRLQNPGQTLIFMGCRKEKIDARFDRHGRITCLIVHTRQKT